MAQEHKGWLLDSLGPSQGSPKSDAQQVYEVLLKMLDRWNAHDIEGHMEVYWKSPELLVVVDAEQFNGWQQLRNSYLNGYPDRSSMGFIEPKRIQVKLLKPDFALALTWWSVSFPTSRQCTSPEKVDTSVFVFSRLFIRSRRLRCGQGRKPA